MTTVDPRVTSFSFRRQALDGSAATGVDALHRVVGVYSAMPGGPLSLRVRVAGLSPDDVRTLETGRAAIRMRAMRTSAFLVPVDTAERVATATAQPASRFAWLLRSAGVADHALPAVRAAVVAVAGMPGAPAELRARLASAGYDASSAPWTQGAALGRVLSLLTATGDLVAIGGASLASNALRYVDRARWLGEAGARPLLEGVPAAEGSGAGPTEGEREAARAWLAGEYLRAFGPARVEDLAWWAGWTPATARAAIAGHEAETGRGTVDVGDGLRLLAADLAAFESAEPLGPRITLLPKWDAWTMGYPLDGRARFLDMPVHDRVFDGDGNGLAMVLRGGRAIGAWAHRATGSRIQADLDLFEPVTPGEREAIETELGGIATFLGYRGVDVRDVDHVIPNRARIRRPLNAGIEGREPGIRGGR